MAGTCKKVGAVECPGGIKGPPDWTCKLVGPPTNCITGWKKVSAGWCEPVLPSAACPAGSMAVIGKTTCQPVGDCGSGDYGTIKIAKDTIHVNAAYSGATSDGTASTPYKTLAAAVKAAKATGKKGHIAMAAGTYKEDVTLDTQVNLEGRCPKLVTLQGTSTDTSTATLTLLKGAGGSVVRGVRVTGPAMGVLVKGANKVLLQGIVIDGTGYKGLRADVASSDTAEVTIKDSLVSGCARSGVSVYSSSLTVEGCEVRATKSTPSPTHGVLASVDASLQTPSKLVVKSSVVRANANYGIGAYTSNVTVERSVISGNAFRGIELAQSGKVSWGGSTGTIKDSLVSANGSAAVMVLNGSTATVTGAVLRDTRETKAAGGKWEAHGLYALGGEVTLSSTAVHGNGIGALMIGGAKATLDTCVVSGTKPRSSDANLGYGVLAYRWNGKKSAVKMTNTLIKGNRFMALALVESEAVVSRCVLRDTTPPNTASTAAIGLGAHVLQDSTTCSKISVEDSTMDNNSALGVLVVGAEASLKRVVVRRTGAAPAKKHPGTGLYAGMANIKTPCKTTVTMDQCLFEDNHGIGIMISDGAVASAKDSTVRGTQPSKNDGQIGFGVSVFGSATLDRCLLEANTRVGFVVGQKGSGMVTGSLVRGTLPAKDPDPYAYGLYAFGDAARTTPTLTIKCSGVEQSKGAGVYILDTSAKIESSHVGETASPYGDGITVYNKQHPARLELTGSLVHNSARAGLLFSGGAGKVCKSSFHSGTFAIVLDKGAKPTICDDNEYHNNKRQGVAFGQNLKPAPVPKISGIPELTL